MKYGNDPSTLFYTILQILCLIIYLGYVLKYSIINQSIRKEMDKSKISKQMLSLTGPKPLFSHNGGQSLQKMQPYYYQIQKFKHNSIEYSTLFSGVIGHLKKWEL